MCVVLQRHLAKGGFKRAPCWIPPFYSIVSPIDRSQGLESCLLHLHRTMHERLAVRSHFAGSLRAPPRPPWPGRFRLSPGPHRPKSLQRPLETSTTESCHTPVGHSVSPLLQQTLLPEKLCYGGIFTRARRAARRTPWSREDIRCEARKRRAARLSKNADAIYTNFYLL